MKKHILVETLLVLVIIGVSFLNVNLNQETVNLRKSIAAQKEKQKDLSEKEDELLYENERLSEKAETSTKSLKEVQKKIANTGADVNLNLEFKQVVTKLFEANLNFTPKNYKERKKEVSSYLSEELNKNYFGHGRNTYQDANTTTSQLDSIEVYPRGLQGNELEGLIVVYHKSKKIDQNWIKGMNIFKVMYDSESKKVTQIINLGSGYSGDMK